MYVCERKRLLIDHTWCLSTVFLCSELKWEIIYFGVNFCGKNVCGNFLGGNLFLQIAGKITKITKITTHKNFVLHGSLCTWRFVLLFTCFSILQRLFNNLWRIEIHVNHSKFNMLHPLSCYLIVTLLLLVSKPYPPGC